MNVEVYREIIKGILRVELSKDFSTHDHVPPPPIREQPPE